MCNNEMKDDNLGFEFKYFFSRGVVIIFFFLSKYYLHFICISYIMKIFLIEQNDKKSWEYVYKYPINIPFTPDGDVFWYSIFSREITPTSSSDGVWIVS